MSNLQIEHDHLLFLVFYDSKDIVHMLTHTSDLCCSPLNVRWGILLTCALPLPFNIHFLASGGCCVTTGAASWGDFVE